MNIRERFEDIFPIPYGVHWDADRGEYMPDHLDSESDMDSAIAWDARLDTFTRCQETTSLVMDHVSELIYELEHCHVNGGYSKDVVSRAKQILGRNE